MMQKEKQWLSFFKLITSKELDVIPNITIEIFYQSPIRYNLIKYFNDTV